MREGRPWEGRNDEAEKVMRERLARGEINEDEYTRLKAHLGNGHGGGGNGAGKGGPNTHSTPRAEGGPLSWLRGDSALELARLRLAKGEITPDEFETLRRVLTS
jgi:putative membrane protein